MYLVTVAPWVELIADVHVLVLRAFLRWWTVSLVLPMFVPEGPGVSRRDYEARNCNAVDVRVLRSDLGVCDLSLGRLDAVRWFAGTY